MTFLALDGFDHYKLDDLNAIGGWNGTPFGQVPGRIDGKGIDVIFANGIWRSISPGKVGFAFQNNSDPAWFGAGGELCFMLDPLQTCGFESNVCPGTPFIVDFKTGLGLDAANRLYLYTTTWADAGACPGHPDKCDKWEPGGTTFYGWGETPALNFGEWNYVEIDFQTLEVRLNGETIITSSSTQTSHGTVYSASGIDDTRFYFTVPNIHNSIWIDDFVAQDASGTFTGDVHIKTLYPDADGTYADWTPGPGGSGTDHFTRVDEHTMDGNASYNYDSHAGDRDSYSMDTLALPSGTIYVTQLGLAASLGNGEIEVSFQAFIRQGGVDYDGAGLTLSAFDETGGGYWLASFVSDTDPVGSPWTVSTVNGDEYGIHLISETPL